MRSTAGSTSLREYAGATAGVLVATALCLLLRSRLATVDVAMLLLVGVVVAAARYRLGPALLATALSIAVFDFLFVPPYNTFNVVEPRYFLTFGVMLVVALTLTRLTARIREQAEAAAEREQRTAALYAMDRELADAGALSGLLKTAEQHLALVVPGEVRILLAEEIRGRDGRPAWPTGGMFESAAARVAASWAWELEEPAGWGMPRGGEADALFAPLKRPGGLLGMVAIRPQDPDRTLSENARDTLLALVDLAAVGLERRTLAERGERARSEVEAEQLRTALLSSLSHDLRTPLASIEGAASSLLESPSKLGGENERELLESILEESRRMTRLVTNLLDMVRVETGTLAVHKSWQPLEEALGVALLRLEDRLHAHPVSARLPSDLPLVPIDELLVEQVFINLLENAARYTDPGTPIEISARPENSSVVVEVADRGPGVPPGEEEAVFERFYQANGTASTDAGAGSGLGLTICRGIIRAHGGKMWLEQRQGGGASVRFTLPLSGPPLDEVPAEPVT